MDNEFFNDFPELKNMRVTVTVDGLGLFDAKQMLEGFFGVQDWPQASGGKVEHSITPNTKLTISVDDP